MFSIIMSEMLWQAKLNFWRPLQVQFSMDVSQPVGKGRSAAALPSPPLG